MLEFFYSPMSNFEGDIYYFFYVERMIFLKGKVNKCLSRNLFREDELYWFK